MSNWTQLSVVHVNTRPSPRGQQESVVLPGHLQTDVELVPEVLRRRSAPQSLSFSSQDRDRTAVPAGQRVQRWWKVRGCQALVFKAMTNFWLLFLVSDGPTKRGVGHLLQGTVATAVLSSPR